MRILWILIRLNIMSIGRAFLNHRYTLLTVGRLSTFQSVMRPQNYVRLRRMFSNRPGISVVTDVGNEKSDSQNTRNTTNFLFGTSPKLFRDMNMSEVLSNGVASIGLKTATVIQSAAFETILSRKEAIIAAETGSGKTLAYLLPIMQQLIDDGRNGNLSASFYPTTIIMLPNKELGEQGIISKYSLGWRHLIRTNHCSPNH